MKSLRIWLWMDTAHFLLNQTRNQFEESFDCSEHISYKFNEINLKRALTAQNSFPIKFKRKTLRIQPLCRYVFLVRVFAFPGMYVRICSDLAIKFLILLIFSMVSAPMCWYVLKAWGSKPGAPKRIFESIPGYMNLKLKEVDQELQSGYMNIFLIRFVLQARGSRTGAAKRVYACIPY